MPHVVMNKRKIDAALGKLQKVKHLLKAFKTKDGCKLSHRCNDTDYRPLQIHRRTQRPPSDPLVLDTEARRARNPLPSAYKILNTMRTLHGLGDKH
jgi:hypothetical protein